MTYEPLQDFIFIEIDPVEETKGGIYVEAKWKDKPPTGTIVAVGKGVNRWYSRTRFNVGDRVLFARYAAIHTPDDNVRACKKDHIIARIKDAA